MKPEAQRIAIAEACGWVRRQWQDRKGRPCSGWRTPEGKELDGSPPDYLNSLDAMHEAEKVLTPMNVPDYVEWLREIESSSDDFSDLVHAEAKKKAEAFLRTLNLWTE